jgi:hypothetical protein
VVQGVTNRPRFGCYSLVRMVRLHMGQFSKAYSSAARNTSLTGVGLFQALFPYRYRALTGMVLLQIWLFPRCISLPGVSPGMLLSQACFFPWYASLPGVPVIGMPFRGVYFIGMHLTGVHFIGVHLTDVYLIGVHVIGVYLSYRVYLIGGYTASIGLS